MDATQTDIENHTYIYCFSQSFQPIHGIDMVCSI